MKAKEVVEIIDPKDVFVGNIEAPVTLMMFGDYESEACAEANEVVKELLELYPEQMNFNFRHFPLTKIHQRSMKAAEAAVGAAQEGKFWEMHNIMFENRRSLGTITLKGYAKEIGVTNKNFLDALINSVYGWHVREDLLDGLSKGVRDVPVFFINNEEYTGKLTVKSMSQAIDLAIVANGGVKKRKKSVGTPTTVAAS